MLDLSAQQWAAQRSENLIQKAQESTYKHNVPEEAKGSQASSMTAIHC